jgi:hypothetical protein
VNQSRVLRKGAVKRLCQRPTRNLVKDFFQNYSGRLINTLVKQYSSFVRNFPIFVRNFPSPFWSHPNHLALYRFLTRKVSRQTSRAQSKPAVGIWRKILLPSHDPDPVLSRDGIRGTNSTNSTSSTSSRE